MSERPRGTVSFLFTDLEESERHWRDSPEAMPTAYARHDAILRQAIAGHGGHLYKVAGDALQAAFPTAPAAVAAALEAQQVLQSEPWSGYGLSQPLLVRMALHAGSVDPDGDGDYRSPILNRLGRLLEAAHGGQVLLTAAIQGLVWEALPSGAGLRDLGETRLKDLAQPSKIYQLLGHALPENFPPLKSTRAPANNLLAQLTAFLGRDAETAALRDLLRREHVRLVTLTGPGGIGKSRLAVQAAAGLLADFADGVWFVELAPIVDPALVPAAIAAALGVRGSVSASLGEVLRAELADKRMLLLLDNFEHLTEAAALLPELMAACPGVKILVTSRVALHMRGEHELSVAPLTLPRRHPPPTLEQLAQYEAVQLFIERAQAVRPDFAVDNASAPAVAEICRRLDGLPLAIELAAARVRFLSPDALLARLERRLELLTGGARDLPERQRTLRQTIAWSYDLLPAEERALFRALAVFAGSFSFQAAEEVAGATPPARGLDTLEGLERLVDKSLLRVVAPHEGGPRFHMLETVREYGLEQLALSADEGSAVRRTHAMFLANLVIGMRQELATGVGTAIAAMEAERDTVRAMLAWLLESGDTETALSAAACLGEYCICTGNQFQEGRSWLEHALALDGRGAAAARGYALYELAAMAIHQGDYTTARAASMEALSLGHATNDPAVIVGALYGLSSVNSNEGSAAEALRQAAEALQIARGMDDAEWLVWTLWLEGMALLATGDLAAARATLEEGLALSRQHDDRWCEADTLALLAFVAGDQGDPLEAANLQFASLAAYQGLGPGLGAPYSLIGVAALAGEAGLVDAAAWLLGAADAHFARFGYGSSRDLSQRSARIERALRARLGDEPFTLAIAHGESLSIDEAIAMAMNVAGEIIAGGAEPLSA